MRRFIFVLIVFYMIDYPAVFSIFLLLHLQLIAMLFSHHVKPLKWVSKQSHYLDIMNDWTIYTSTCVILNFTEFVHSPDTRYKAGWILILVQGFSILISLTVAFVNFIGSCIKTFKICKIKKARAKFSKQK